MRFAILGAGFAGLGVAWHLINYTQGSATVDLFDPTPIGGGASGLSSGLLNPFAGKQARRAWEDFRCMHETHRLITEASRASGQPVILSKGILRPALSSQQIADFKEVAEKNEETEWWEKKKCEETVSGLQLPEEGGGLFIKNGLTLDVQTYLQGLWRSCALLGTQYHQQAKVRIQDLEEYDKVLIAIGPLVKNFPPLKELPINSVKGQILELKWPTPIPPLPFSLNSQKYIVMGPDQKTCLVGATYEREFTSPRPDQEKAVEEILPKIISYFPPLKNAEVVGCRAGFRASTPNHLPLVGKMSDKFFFYTGLGSKGLLYHGWVGKRVARTLLTGDIKHVPEKIYFSLPSPKDKPQG